MPEPDHAILEGAISVLAALYARNREVHALYVDAERRGERSRDMHELRDLAEARGLTIEYKPRDELDALATGKSHGGIVADAGPRRFEDLPSLLPPADRPGPPVVMLDGIEDPYNFGYAVRALYAAGVRSLVVRPRNWTTAAATVARASAGASELIRMALADTPEAAAEQCRTHGLPITATAYAQGATDLYEARLDRPRFLLIGGERRGIKRAFLDQADELIAIPYDQPFPHSLGTVAAASVIAFEALRQRRAAKPERKPRRQPR